MSPSTELGDIIAEPVKESDFYTMTGALLHLTAAGHEDRGERSALVGTNYDQKAAEVAEFVLEINEYSVLDEYSEGQIVQTIENEDDETGLDRRWGKSR